jgi:hypothetical protein
VSSIRSCSGGKSNTVYLMAARRAGSTSLSARAQNRRWLVSMAASVRPEPWSRALVTRANSRKCWYSPGSLNGWPRSARWQQARLTVAAPDRCLRDAASSASTLVGSLTTSLPRVVEITRSWLTGPTAEQAPSGATGDRSTPANSSGSSDHSRDSSCQTGRGSATMGCT